MIHGTGVSMSGRVVGGFDGTSRCGTTVLLTDSYLLCAPCSVGDLLLVFLCLRLFIVMSRGILVKGTNRQIMVFLWVIMSKSLVRIWCWLTHTWLANKSQESILHNPFEVNNVCECVCVKSNSWPSWPSVVAYISGLICNDKCIKFMFPMHRERGALDISWMNWVCEQK